MAISYRYSRYSSPATTCLLVTVAVVMCQLMQPANSFSTNRQQLQRLLGNLNIDDEEEAGGQVYDEDVSHVSKRESKGTCTCTCETRPVSASAAASDQSSSGPTAGIVQHPSRIHSENRFPESAALMRTATMMAKDSKSKSQQLQQQPTKEVKSAQLKTVTAQKPSVGYGHIVKVPPAPEYDMSELASNDVINSEPEVASEETEDESTKQQEPEESRHSQQETWSLGSRYPWERLPDTMCFREHCSADRDCCRRFNICDRSAHVCVDCWYGSTCTSERDCCLKYKYCQREWKTNPASGKLEIVGGKCVNEL